MTRWVLRLIIANILVFVVSSASPEVTSAFALIPAAIIVRPWTLITYMFLHANFLHIFFNMLALFFFGPRLEVELGERNFAILYFTSGIMGGLLSFVFMPYTPIIGASGAVFGVMLGFAYYWPYERIYIYGILPVQARILVIIMTALSLYGGLGYSSDNVAHFAHLGGFLGGYLVLRLTDRRRRATRASAEQAAGPVRDEDLARWQSIPRDKLHQVNREELDRIMAKLRAGGPKASHSRSGRSSTASARADVCLPAVRQARLGDFSYIDFMPSIDSFHTLTKLSAEGKEYSYFALSRLPRSGAVERLPFSMKILLENVLRNEDGKNFRSEDIQALAGWEPAAVPSKEISFMPARVLLQDFTGVPCAVDLAVMRDAMVRMKGDPKKINPLQPVDLVIDHSVQVDFFGTADAFARNSEKEFERNKERYAFLRWSQQAFSSFRVVPPDTGIVHQVNLEYLAAVVSSAGQDGAAVVYPDTLVGTDSHTTMINGLGVLGWGVGGIEAEAAMLGQPISMLIPQVVGFRMHGAMPAGSTATDLVLTVTQMLRKKGVVGKFVEFFGPGLSSLSLADRATIANMAPEYGATMGFFPVDDETLNYLRLTGRSSGQVALVEAYCKAQGLFRTSATPDSVYSDTLDLDLSTVEPSLAGPKRPQDRVSLSHAKPSYRKSLVELLEAKGASVAKESATRWIEEGGTTTQAAMGHDGAEALHRTAHVRKNGTEFDLTHGSVVIAAITSCTNTSNPAVMIAAGLLAKKAVAKGLSTRPWVKTSLAPGSMVVTDYLEKAGLSVPLDRLGFSLVGYGCTTCIGNSGPLPEQIAKAVQENDLVAVSVLSGNRNFEGRINPHVRANYLASPPLVVAYAIAGTMDIDIQKDPLGKGADGKPVYLKDIWPSPAEVESTLRACVGNEMFLRRYADVFKGDDLWRSLGTTKGDRYPWEAESTYIKPAPFFEDMPATPVPVADIKGARTLAILGDSVTTDHISPAGSIPKESPAGKYLISKGVEHKDFNSYGARRGNHEVMMRGTFANIRLRNLMVPGTEGGWSRYRESDQPQWIFDVAMKYVAEGTPLIVIAGKEYGSGSSRDWAAKGPCLLGVKAIIAESFERIHRSNLVGMGILPLQFIEGQNRDSLKLDGTEEYAIEGIQNGLRPGARLKVSVTGKGGAARTFEAVTRIDTPIELDYYKNGGILQYVLRSLLKS